MTLLCNPAVSLPASYSFIHWHELRTVDSVVNWIPSIYVTASQNHAYPVHSDVYVMSQLQVPNLFEERKQVLIVVVDRDREGQ